MEVRLLINNHFHGLQSNVPNEREETLRQIKNAVRGWLKSSPRLVHNDSDDRGSHASIPPSDPSNSDVNSDERTEKTLELYLLAILRMSVNCPYADVRHASKNFLDELSNMGVSVPSPIFPYPSLYISPKEIYTLEWIEKDKDPLEEPIGTIPDDNTQNLMTETFIDAGRLSNYYRILSYFPTFTKKFQNACKEMLKRENCVLPEPHRYYIGIMAASQHKCRYLVSHLTNEYLNVHGDPKWLNGLDHAPAKFKKIAQINSILAHQPWILRADHIDDLCKGHWKIQEVIHIIVLLSTFHSLSSYLLCCGIVPECDSIGGHKERPSSTFPTSDRDEIGTSVGLNYPEQTSAGMGSGLGIHVDVKDQSGEKIKEKESEKDVDDEAIKLPDQSDKRVKEEESVDTEATKAIEEKESEKNVDAEAIKRFKRKEYLDAEAILHTNQLIRRLEERENEAMENESEKDKEDKDSAGESNESTEDNLEEEDEFVNCDEETFSRVSTIENTPVISQHTPSASSPISVDASPVDMTPPVDLLTNDFSHYLDPEVEVSYSDFVFSYQVLRSHEFNWGIHGVAMVDNHLGFGDILDKELKEIRYMNDSKFFAINDDRPLREAIRHYVYRLHGIQKDDFQYKDLKHFLNLKIRNFIKKACFKPEDFTYDDWINAGFQLKAKEKCQIILISAEARKQAELTYGLRSVDLYLTRKN